MFRLLSIVAQTDFGTYQAAERAAPYWLRLVLIVIGILITAIMLYIIDRRR